MDVLETLARMASYILVMWRPYVGLSVKVHILRVRGRPTLNLQWRLFQPLRCVLDARRALRRAGLPAGGRGRRVLVGEWPLLRLSSQRKTRTGKLTLLSPVVRRLLIWSRVEAKAVRGALKTDSPCIFKA